MDLDRLIDAMAVRPREILGITDNGWCMVDLDASFEVDPGSFRSKGRSTPFEGMELYGKVISVHPDLCYEAG